MFIITINYTSTPTMLSAATERAWWSKDLGFSLASVSDSFDHVNLKKYSHQPCQGLWQYCANLFSSSTLYKFHIFPQ